MKISLLLMLLFALTCFSMSLDADRDDVKRIADEIWASLSESNRRLDEIARRQADVDSNANELRQLIAESCRPGQA